MKPLVSVNGDGAALARPLVPAHSSVCSRSSLKTPPKGFRSGSNPDRSCTHFASFQNLQSWIAASTRRKKMFRFPGLVEAPFQLSSTVQKTLF